MAFADLIKPVTPAAAAVMPRFTPRGAPAPATDPAADTPPVPRIRPAAGPSVPIVAKDSSGRPRIVNVIGDAMAGAAGVPAGVDGWTALAMGFTGARSAAQARADKAQEKADKEAAKAAAAAERDYQHGRDKISDERANRADTRAERELADKEAGVGTEKFVMHGKLTSAGKIKVAELVNSRAGDIYAKEGLTGPMARPDYDGSRTAAADAQIEAYRKDLEAGLLAGADPETVAPALSPDAAASPGAAKVPGGTIGGVEVGPPRIGVGGGPPATVAPAAPPVVGGSPPRINVGPGNAGVLTPPVEAAPAPAALTPPPRIVAPGAPGAAAPAIKRTATPVVTPAGQFSVIADENGKTPDGISYGADTLKAKGLVYDGKGRWVEAAPPPAAAAPGTAPPKVDRPEPGWTSPTTVEQMQKDLAPKAPPPAAPLLPGLPGSTTNPISGDGSVAAPFDGWQSVEEFQARVPIGAFYYRIDPATGQKQVYKRTK